MISMLLVLIFFFDNTVERQLVQLRKQIAIISEKKTNLQHQLKEAEKTRSNNFQVIYFSYWEILAMSIRDICRLV